MKVGWEGKWKGPVGVERVGGGAVGVQDVQPARRAGRSMSGLSLVGGGGSDGVLTIGEGSVRLEVFLVWIGVVFSLASV